MHKSDRQSASGGQESNGDAVCRRCGSHVCEVIAVKVNGLPWDYWECPVCGSYFFAPFFFVQEAYWRRGIIASDQHAES